MGRGGITRAGRRTVSIQAAGGRRTTCVFFLRRPTRVLDVLACLSSKSSPAGPVALVTCVGDWADSGDVRLRERHVRAAGVFATEHAEEFGQAHPTRTTQPNQSFS